MVARNLFAVRISGVRSLTARSPSSSAKAELGDTPVGMPSPGTSGSSHVALFEQVGGCPQDAANLPAGAPPQAPAQVPYRPLSSLPAGGALIPAALAEGTQRALATFRERFGEPDPWLQDRLGWTREELAARLTAEQADAVALALAAAEAGEGFILADATGFGKGRIVWAIAAGLLRQGERVLFLTETENLFSDAWRDIRHIDAAEIVGRPLIINSGARITDLADPDASSPFPPWRPAEIQEILRSGRLPTDIRVVFATYSQFFRLTSAKAEWLRNIAAQCHMLLDEAHNVVGRGSNTNTLFREIIPAAKSAVFSSATFSRDVGNTAVYASVFPWLKPLLRQAGKEMAKEDIPAAVRRVLAQESVRLAVERGRLIRREADMSGVVLEFRTNEAEMPRREEFAEAAAQVFAAMAKIAALARVAADRANEHEGCDGEHKRARRLGLWQSLPMGGVLATLVDHMEAALLVRDAFLEADRALRQGEKPVIVVENTLETFLRELFGDGVAVEEEGEETIAEDDSSPGEDKDAVLSIASFADACRLAVRRLSTITRRKQKGGPVEKQVVATRDMTAAIEQAETAIRNLPSLSLSPIDDIMAWLRDAGWRVKEISGRTSLFQGGRLVPRGEDDRNLAIAGFNHGDVDALIVTRAGATGLSLHASVEFRDSRRRRMIFLRMLRSPVKMVQMMGRVFRRGQMNTPAFVVLSCGLPSEIYSFAMQRRKLEELSAAVTGQPRGLATLDVPDPFNSLGEKLAKEILIDRPDVARRMGLSLEEEQAAWLGKDEHGLVRRFFRRLPALPVSLQKRLLESFFTSYRERLEAGEDPEGTDARLPGTWREEEAYVVHSGDGTSCPVLGPPARLIRLVGKKAFTPLRSEAVRKMVASATAQPEALRSRAEVIVAYRQRALLAAAGGNAFAVDQALRDPGENPVKALDRRLGDMVRLLRTLAPGIGAQLPDGEGRGREAVVVDVILAPSHRALSARDYRVVYAIPGERAPRRLGLDVLLSSKVTVLWDARHGQRVLAAFDQAVQGTRTERRLVVVGSLPRAAMEAMRITPSGGVRVEWLSEEGKPRVGFLLPKDMETVAIQTCVGLSDPYVMAHILANGGRIWSSASAYEGGALVVPERSGFFFHWPEGRREAAALAEAGLDWIRQEYPHGYVPGTVLERLCLSLTQACGTVYCDTKWRSIIDTLLEKRRDAEAQNSIRVYH